MIRKSVALVAVSALAWTPRLVHGQDLFLVAQQPPAASTVEISDAPPVSVQVGQIPGLGADPITGRVRLYLQRHNDSLPVDGNSDNQDTNQVFGVDANAIRPGESVPISGSTLGYPVASLEELPAGTYFVQAELARYTLFNRTGLQPTWLPTTCVSNGGQNGEYAKPAGTLLSKVSKMTLEHLATGPRLAGEEGSRIILDSVQRAFESSGCAGLGDAVDSEYMKTVRIESGMLTKWWGTPITLEACVLLPFGWGDAEHSQATYPLVIAHGHYSPRWFAGGGFQTSKPQCDPEASGYPCVNEWYNWYLFQNWTSTDPAVSPFVGARMLLMTINHPVPFFDDSYAVNSANVGPYGDAIMRELVPAVERKFRGIGAGWARGAMGGSTGGWESFAMPVLFPDDFNAAFAACPDPVTFTHYTTIDIYKQANAYFYDSEFKRTQLPGLRDGYDGTYWPGYKAPYGEIIATVAEQNHRELVLGEHSRSCGQWDIWEAVFSPACADGFPCRLYDKLTGKINKTIAEHWREHYDLAAIIRRDWKTLGPKLNGSLHVFVGGSDSFYLTNAVMDAQDLIESIDPRTPTGIEWVVGAHDGRGFQHCFRGNEKGPDGQPIPNSLARLTYAQAFLPKMAERFSKTAPPGADTISWRY